ncbi:hypothetical protein MUK42_20416 [Musa troglodytarum]|uniref:Oleosin n=1 Tax=Musa troglodytarum TaxID=320322 RepID=A0A9E7G5H5_9LILI|nr:hypothetical protein MUK42_20416 [Musa troglodytarum]
MSRLSHATHHASDPPASHLRLHASHFFAPICISSISEARKKTEEEKMAEYGIDQSYRLGEQQQVVVKAVLAAVAGTSLLVLSGLTLAWTVIALAVATPLLMIFSPVLVSAAIVLLLLATGFLASGGLGVAALVVLWWMYKDLTGKQPPGVELLEQVRQRLVSKARDIRESVMQQQQPQQATQ